MFSLNAPVPGAVERLAADLDPAFLDFGTVRRTHSILLKRLDDGDPARIETEARQALAGASPVEARVTGIDAFLDPPLGPGPVVYLAVESPGLHGLHRRLVDAFGAVEGLEGDGYVPHVTLARDGPRETVERLRDRTVEPVEWTVRELFLRTVRGRERAATIALG